MAAVVYNYNDQAWALWTSSASSTCTASNTSGTWIRWVTNACGIYATNAASDAVWVRWAAAGSVCTATNAYNVCIPVPEPRQLTPEKVAEHEEKRRIAREEWERDRATREAREAREREEWEKGRPAREAEAAERRAKIAAEQAEQKRLEEEADKRAEELLVAHLDDEQKVEYRKDRTFRVRDRNGHRYRIHRAWSGHVTRLQDVDGKEREVERFCIHPRIKVPLPDNQLFAKLMLETDPETFRKTANVTQMAVPPVPNPA